MSNPTTPPYDPGFRTVAAGVLFTAIVIGLAAIAQGDPRGVTVVLTAVMSLGLLALAWRWIPGGDGGDNE